jgi:hypothetical protein
MEVAITWLKLLEPDDAKLAWTRAEGASQKAVCWRFGISRAIAHRRWGYGLCLIAWQLNGRPSPCEALA